jgi:hypothetical protein
VIREQFEREVFPQGEPEEVQRDVSRIYNQHVARPYVCKLISDVLSGRWGLGSTQQMLAERFGIDRTLLSDGRRHGKLSFEIYFRLRCCPSRPPDWEPNLVKLAGEMERCAFVAIARYYASCVPHRPGLVPEEMDETNYELLCEILANLASWLLVRRAGDLGSVRRLVQRVVIDERRQLVPMWYTARQRRQAEALVGRLLRDDEFALSHLRQLQQNWLDIFVWTFDATCFLKWSES